MLQLPEILEERYQLLRQLNDHVHRQTWLAKDLISQKNVVVKLLAFSPQMQWDEFKLFEREGQVLKQLNHSKIPQYRDYFALDQKIAGLHWFALVHDYIAGHSLQELLDQGVHFTESQIGTIATGILEILIYLHSFDPPILHRDIKPSNLILSKDQQVYLVDFGAVQDPVAVDGATFTVVGSAGYAPLEQFWGKAVPASDLYALGTTLIHLLTGIAPINLPQQNLRLQFRDQVSINPTLIQWIETLTEPDLNCRFKNASQALEFLQTRQSYQSAFEKPQNSKIQFNQTKDYMTIILPKQNLSLSQKLSKFILNILWIGIAYPLQLLSGCSIFLFLVLSLALLANHFIAAMCLFGFTCLVSLVWINSIKEIGKIHKIICQYSLKTWRAEAIIMDHRIFSIDFCSETSQSVNLQDILSIQENNHEQITLKFFKNNCPLEISFGSSLTQPERKWLLQEIQVWINSYTKNIK